MLSRHFLREKVLQSLYAYYLDEDADMLTFEKNMLKAIDGLYNLFIYQLSLIPELANIISQQIENSDLKYFPTDEEKKSDMKLFNDVLFSKLVLNRDLKRKCEILKVNWRNEQDVIKAIYKHFKTQKSYEDYISIENPSLVDSKRLMSSLFKFAVNYPALVDKFIERNLYWEDDFFQVAQMSLNAICSVDDSFDEDTLLPTFFSEKNIEDREFIVELFRKTILNDHDLTEIIKNRISKWEYDRIALIDIILVKMAIVEFLYFSSIPVKVTINEYIELSKEFSTEKSKTFINAILDRIVVDLKDDGLLKKAGRGLINE